MSQNIIVFIIVISIILGCAIAYWERMNYNQVPRKIWTYWDNPDKIPKMVVSCMESWKKHNPDYTITVLTKKNFFNYINIPKEVSSHPNFRSEQQFADLVCIYALAEHGGIWIDPCVIVKEPLDNWIFPRYAELSAFYTESLTNNIATPIIENWFIACNKGSIFIKEWFKEFLQVANYPSTELYIKSRENMNIDFQNITNPIDRAIIIAAQKIIQLDKYPLDSLILKKAEDGPLKYLYDAKWDSEKALRLACSDKKYQMSIMKLERKAFEENIDFEEKCALFD